MTDWLKLATEICYPTLNPAEVAALTEAGKEQEICEGCEQPIEDYGDPYQIFDGPLCSTCYSEIIND